MPITQPSQAALPYNRPMAQLEQQRVPSPEIGMPVLGASSYVSVQGWAARPAMPMMAQPLALTGAAAPYTHQQNGWTHAAAPAQPPANGTAYGVGSYLSMMPAPLSTQYTPEADVGARASASDSRTDEEFKATLEHVHRCAEKMGTGRTAKAAQQRLREGMGVARQPVGVLQKQPRQQPPTGWTAAEDRVLLDHVSQFWPCAWAACAAKMGTGRTARAVQSRWAEIYDTEAGLAALGRAPVLPQAQQHAGFWTEEEDEALLNHVAQFGPKYWDEAVANLGTCRSSDAAQIRWHKWLKETDEGREALAESYQAGNNQTSVLQPTGERQVSIAVVKMRAPPRKQARAAIRKPMFRRTAAGEVCVNTAGSHRDVRAVPTVPPSCAEEYSSCADGGSGSYACRAANVYGGDYGAYASPIQPPPRLASLAEYTGAESGGAELAALGWGGAAEKLPAAMAEVARSSTATSCSSGACSDCVSAAAETPGGRPRDVTAGRLLELHDLHAAK